MRIFQVDAFADRPFTGNPAAVCLLEEDRDDGWMQAMAAEMNLSETAFVTGPGPGRFGLRWFTPTTEVDLCGHATLASAHVLWETGAADGPIVFETRSGDLTATEVDGGVALDFPADPPVETTVAPELAAALGVEPRWQGRSARYVVVELADEAAVLAAAPSFPALAVLARGVAVTARSDGDGDFVSRFFAPALGVDEDLVTGSAHCVLGPLWAERLGRHRLVGRQLSRRGGTVTVEVDGDRVILIGPAVTVLSGRIA